MRIWSIFPEFSHPGPRGISETLAEIHVDASSLTLTRAEAHDSANPAPSLVPGAQALLQCRATPGRLSHAIVRLLYPASGNLSAFAVYVGLCGGDAAGASPATVVERTLERMRISKNKH
jgi:hypothetical protein